MKPIIIKIEGAPGTGKTRIARSLGELLESGMILDGKLFTSPVCYLDVPKKSDIKRAWDSDKYKVIIITRQVTTPFYVDKD